MVGNKRWIPYGFLAPAVLGLLVFRIVPIGVALFGSLFSFQLIGQTRTFVGLDNFAQIFGDDVFWTSFQNTLVFAVGVTAIQVFFSLGLAVIVSRDMPGTALFRTLLFVPVVTSMVVTAAVWKLAYNTDGGLINAMLSALNLPRQPFLISPATALFAVMAMVIWKGVGYWMAVFIAGLRGIPSSIYEAATIDGATGFRSFRYITLPLLRRHLAFVVVADTSINMLLFAPIYLMTRGGPGDSSSVLMYYTYNTAFVQGEMGYASALAVLLLLVSGVVIALELRFLRSTVEY